MIPDTIIEAFNSVTPTTTYCNPEEQKCWQQLFAFYNRQFPERFPLGMGCRPCYPKVYNFIKQMISIEEAFG